MSDQYLTLPLSIYGQVRLMWRQLAGATAVSVLVAIFGVVQPAVVQKLVNNLEKNTAVGHLIFLLVVFVLAEAAAGSLQTYILGRIGETFVYRLRCGLVSRVLRWPIREFDRRDTGDIMSRLGADATLVRVVVTSGFAPMVTATLLIVAAAYFMIKIDAGLFAVAVGTVLTGVLVVVLLGRLVRRSTFAAQRATGTMTVGVSRALGGVRTIRAARAEDTETRRLTSMAADVKTNGMRVVRLTALTQPTMTICTQAIFVVVLIYGASRVADGSLRLGDLIGFILYVFLLINPVSIALQAYSDIQMGLGAWQRISELRSVPQEHSYAASSSEDATEAKVTEARMVAKDRSDVAIRFDKVNFSYTAGSPVLRDLTFEVEKGAWLAIVGPSGSGKTTILSLLEQFYTLDSGSIMVNGDDATWKEPRAIRDQFVYLEQDGPVLAGTIFENLSLGNDSCTENRAWEALEATQLTDVVSRKSGGLHAPVGENGVLLSGGQRQRLGWARVLLSAAPIVLMDEPTSSLDAATEEALNGALETVMNGRTRIVVSHRLSTVVNADQILVLDRGAVNALGTHSALMGSSELYRGLARRQMLL